MTAHQRRIAELVCKGKTNKEIAAVLGCSHRTVGNTLARMFIELRIRRRIELATLMSAAAQDREAVQEAERSSGTQTGAEPSIARRT